MRKPMVILVVLFICLGGWIPHRHAVASPLPQGSGPVSGSIRCPDNYEPPSLEPRASSASTAATSGLKAVAIVGEVGSLTDDFRDDMDGAVEALEAKGVSVTKFYYGVTTFTWSDIVVAAQGAHVLVYMGHGVHGWGPPNNWGGFSLGDSQFVSPSQVRTDLKGVLAVDSIIIFSHACFTAGSSSSDSYTIPQSEAEERVHSYAEPFVDIGMEAYFANNYWDSAARTVNLLLDDDTMEDVFKGGVGYNPTGLVDLSYPEPNYDLWLDKCAYAQDWNLSFVGLPDYVFQAVMCPWPDFDCSGAVDVLDVQAVAGSWRCAQGETCYQAEYDWDADGTISTVDIMAVVAEWD